jgi:hypothetical protein
MSRKRFVVNFNMAMAGMLLSEDNQNSLTRESYVCVSACTNSFLISMQGTDLIVFGSKFHYHLPLSADTFRRSTVNEIFQINYFFFLNKLKTITIASALNSS